MGSVLTHILDWGKPRYVEGHAGASGIWERTPQAGLESQLLTEGASWAVQGKPSTTHTLTSLRGPLRSEAWLQSHHRFDASFIRQLCGKENCSLEMGGRKEGCPWRISWWPLPLGVLPRRAAHSAFGPPCSILPGSQDPGSPDKATAPLHFPTRSLRVLGSPDGPSCFSQLICSQSGGRMVAAFELPDSGGLIVTYTA